LPNVVEDEAAAEMTEDVVGVDLNHPAEIVEGGAKLLQLR